MFELKKQIYLIALLTLFVFSIGTGAALAQEEGPDIVNVARGLDTVWVLLGAFLVFFMQAGFGMLEAGLIRSKNTVNILMKNFLDFSIATLGFFLVGYAIMFGSGNDFFGASGFLLKGVESPAGVPVWAFWLFQAAFCGAAATIVAGGMAERMKFPAYLAYSFVISTLIYPVIGHWIWGGGWLSKMGFTDFAGSTVVHLTGGVAALTGTIILGPRIGKFAADGTAKIIAGHNIPLASLGVFILWFGWFGFNAGSTLGVGNGDLIGLIAMNTNIAAAAGGLAAMLLTLILFKAFDLTMTMNGALAGLVAITAPCAFVSPGASFIIGAIGGVLVVLAVSLLDLLRIDDPVGAFPVHGVNGIWGTLAVGLFGQKALGLGSDGLLIGGGLSQLTTQIIGIFSVAAFVTVAMSIVFKLIDLIIGLRVSREEELRGLDIGEHKMESYAGFQIFTTD